MVSAQLFYTKDAQLRNNSGNHMASQNSKWRYAGNLKSRIGDKLKNLDKKIFKKLTLAKILCWTFRQLLLPSSAKDKK